MASGIETRRLLAAEIERADLDADRKRVTEEELEQARERQQELRDQIDRCRSLLERSRTWVGFQPEPFRNALSCSLELLGADPLEATTDELGRPVWRFPSLDRRAASDPSWAATLDTLRAPRPSAQKLTDWRREAPIRPIVFEDEGVITDETVHLHLEQRVAQRLLARFRAQGFIYKDISRACLVQVSDSIPRVVLLGRVSLYGARRSSASTRSWSQSLHGGPSRIVETVRSRHTRARPSGAVSDCSTPHSATARTSLLVPLLTSCWHPARQMLPSFFPSSSAGQKNSLPRPARSCASGGAARARCFTRHS